MKVFSKMHRKLIFAVKKWNAKPYSPNKTILFHKSNKTRLSPTQVGNITI